MSASLDLLVLRGPAITPYLEELARLRIAVFAEWPYLYEGDPAYERDYLAAYARSADSVCVLAREGGRAIGASTGLPLLDDAPGFAQAFQAAGLDPAAVFYFGESVLLPAYRGRGLGHAFFDARERHARGLGHYAATAFCAVDRADEDARRPVQARDHGAFWRKRGYARQPGLCLQLPWPERGRGEVLHRLTFWTRPLEARA